MAGATDRAGARYERNVADFLHDEGEFPWDKAPLRGRRDRLDITGCLDYGWLIGCKAIHRGVTFGQRISEAMAQCDAALVNVGQDGPGRIVPVQFMQRSGFPIRKHYVVTEAEYFLALARERAGADRAARADR